MGGSFPNRLLAITTGGGVGERRQGKDRFEKSAIDLRAYYTMFYDRMRAQAGSRNLRTTSTRTKAQYLAVAGTKPRSPLACSSCCYRAGKQKEASGIASPKPKLRTPEPPLPQ